MSNLTSNAIELAKILSLICKENFPEIYNNIAKQVLFVLKNGHSIYICGNGGSYSIAEHFAGEFTGRFQNDMKPFPVMALGGGSHITCVANDYSFKDVFSRQIQAYGKSDDLLIAMSTSGNSENILEGIIASKAIGMQIITLLGKDGGKLKGYSELEFIVPSYDVARIQEIHQFILHCICQDVLNQLK